MRLIDGDALKERLQTLAYDDWNQGVSTSWADAYRECAGMVDDMPTIQPDQFADADKMVERKKGEWIKISHAGIYECSRCGKNVMTGDITAYDFCHGCGTDMRGEQE